MRFFRIGTVKGNHGLDGELKLVATTDNIALFDELEYLILGKNHQMIFSSQIEYIEPQNNYMIVKVKDIKDMDSAAKYKGFEVLIPESMLPDEEDDEVYWYKIDGSKVVDECGNEIGVLCDYIESGAADVFRIRKINGGYYLISNNKDHVLSINPEEKIIIVLKEGLVDEDI
ncbi:MAG: ribosome maturation factor RimM [Deferribacterales bacterium]